MNDPYSILGVTRGATDREIKKAYREMSRKYHPDSYPDESQKAWAENKFREVQEAYNQIVDERSGRGRQEYSGYGGRNDSCGTGNICCDLWCADTLCECMGGDLCSCM